MSTVTKQVLATFLTAFSLHCAGMTWHFPGHSWSYCHIPGPWSLLEITRDTNEAGELSSCKVDWKNNRLVYTKEQEADAGCAAITVDQFKFPGNQTVTLENGAKTDSAVAYKVKFNGRLAVSVLLQKEDSLISIELWKNGKPADAHHLEPTAVSTEKGLLLQCELDARTGDWIVFRNIASPKEKASRCDIAVTVQGTGYECIGNWSAFAVPWDRLAFDDYQPLIPVKFETGYSCTAANKLPQVKFTQAEGWDMLINFRPTTNEKNPDGAGDAVAVYQISETGSYRLQFEIENIGLPETKAGNGISFRASYIPPGTPQDASDLFFTEMPPACVGQPADVFDRTIRLNAGDKLLFRAFARHDDYADNALLKFRIAKTDDEAEYPHAPTTEAMLPAVDCPRIPANAIHRGMFWTGTRAEWWARPVSHESVDFLTKFFPGSLVLIHGGNRPDYAPISDYVREKGIPTLGMTFGNLWEPYFKYNGAYEWDMRLRDMSEKIQGVGLSGGAHAFAMAHPAYKTAFDSLARSCVINGYGGYGFPDYVWWWPAGPSGHSPATRQAFYESLTGQDEGITVDFGDGNRRQFHFADYVEFYVGGRPEPSWLGLNDWSNYNPPETNDISDTEWAIFDMLCHYEYLKNADRMGRAAEKEGGILQILPNPEDRGNANDGLFLAALSHVYANTEEYFRPIAYSNGIYARWGYMKDRRGNDRESGIVMESGWGGNANPYFTISTALRNALEGTLAGKFDHLEGDSWPQLTKSIKESAETNLTEKRKLACLTAFGLGFKYGHEDAAFKRVAPEFAAVSTRNNFRPWYKKHLFWPWWLDGANSVELALIREGYSFYGAGDEGVANNLIPDNLKTVVLEACPVTQDCYEALMSELKAGKRKQVIVSAATMKTFINRKIQERPFSELAPELTIEETAAVPGIDRLYRVDAPGAVTELEWEGKPAVVSYPVGKGRVYVICFAIGPYQHTEPEPNPEARKYVMDALLSKFGARQYWRSSNPVQGLLYSDGERYIATASRHDFLYDHQTANSSKIAIYPETTEGTATFQVRLVPGKSYLAISFPELGRQTITAGDDGFATISLGNRVHAIFYLIDVNDTEFIEKLNARAKEFRLAQTLDGRFEEPIE